jgi:hypothetical protein
MNAHILLAQKVGLGKFIVRLIEGDPWAYLELVVWVAVIAAFLWVRKWWLDQP